MLNPAPALLLSRELRAIESSAANISPCLMERAGAAAAELATQLLGKRPGPVLVLAGPGNNGGDGFVLARCLRERGHAVHLACQASAEQMPTDARAARERWLTAGGEIHTDFADQAWALAVDALFGIGLSRPIDAAHAEWIARFNALPCPRLALDLPSGLHADTGQIIGPCVHASHTASFIALKPGLFTLDGPDHSGEIHAFDLGLPPPASTGSLLTPACFADWLHPRRRNTHKGSYGSAGIIGGAAGMQGAAMLAARAALHLGPGKVFLGLLEATSPGFDPGWPELILRNPGKIASQVSAMAIGPGLGTESRALALLREALTYAGPLLLDADALNLLATDEHLQAQCRERQILNVITPHPLEAARLLGCDVAQVQADRIHAASTLAQQLNAACVLKGCGSIIASPDGRWWINPNGNPGMASGGMGDALSGFIVALLAQGWPADAAALAATHLHGAAADLCATEGTGPVGLRASETLAPARQIFNGWLRQAPANPQCVS